MSQSANKTNLKFFFLGGLTAAIVASVASVASSVAPMKGIPQASPPAMKLSSPLPENLFSELYRIVNPAVVHISTTAMARGRMLGNDPFRDMLEELYGIERSPNKPRPLGLGSGFIVREDGLIVTNNHVIEGADTINIKLVDNPKTYEAKIIGRDARTDIALLKIESTEKFPVAALGSSKDLQVGEWVVAFGNPFGLDHSVSKGIVSSKKLREISGLNKIPLIQSDALVNPGNSGGPLVNTKGYVVGVNNAINGAAQGISFAIPIDEVKSVITQLEKRGSLQKGYIGAGLGDLDQNALESLGIEGGAIIGNLERGGPAAKAGLRPYDIVTEFNGKKIKSSLDLIDAVGDTTPGKETSAKILRNSKSLDLKVVVAERPSDAKLAKAEKASVSTKGEDAPYKIGMKLGDMSAELRANWDLPDEIVKPVVLEVRHGSIASRIGVKPGDIVLSVNKTDVETAKDAVGAFKKGQNEIRLARESRIIIITFEAD